MTVVMVVRKKSQGQHIVLTHRKQSIEECVRQRGGTACGHLQALTPSLAACTAIWPFLAIVEATLTASSTTLPSRTTREMRPRRSASSALKLRPVSTISMAVDLPTALVRRWVPPAPGMTPRLISGWPKLAVGEARMMSHLCCHVVICMGVVRVMGQYVPVQPDPIDEKTKQS